ncbi:hypothetical protein L6164_012982 [Bauhinia variegata]|uniref:Uncharacterized protein n=1 Tax=Bauhinia variegata TaxID=167791 RepID=A0ACB9PC17_BAUVA|nr:hypothetical protein L6164_012982 [Bauhinia variegata]
MDEFHEPKFPLEEEDDLYDHQLPLRSAPSFEIYNTNEGFGDDPEQVLLRTFTIGDSIEAIDSDDFSFRKKGMDLIEEEEENENRSVEEEAERLVSPPMNIEAGLGVDGKGFGGGVRSGSYTSDILSMPNMQESSDLEEDYKRLVDEYPNHPLFLRNYAQLLQSKGDLHGAEEYFLRATLADPDDGEILMRCGKLVWELHRDKERALHYLEQAVQAAPQDSDISAAYASFLWETEDDEDSKGDEKLETNNENDEENYYKMIDENPTNPSFLKNYAQFLMQSMGDLQGAEDYFLRATQEDPEDGEILMQYAKLVWELHHDKDRALHYFERASQASPQDSHVLAAYASFLWEIEDDEEEGGKQETNSKDNEKEQQIKLVNPSQQRIEPVTLVSHLAAGQEIDHTDLTAANCGKHGNLEDCHKKMIDENPTNPLFLKIYARFLVQSKKDLQAAEEYYSRAILADPHDGEILSEYAQLVWELHHDQEKALLYFEQAVQASPTDSHVLAAYACFLWEIDDGEANISRESPIQEPLLQENTATAANA